MSVFNNNRPMETGGARGVLSALGWLNRMLSFFCPFFKPHACHLFLCVQIQEKEENDITVTMRLLLEMKLDSFFVVFFRTVL